MSESQIRLNKATHEWVIYAPHRRQRHQDFQQQNQENELLEKPHCPLCQINEPIILELLNPEKNHWQTRVLLNKFPVLTLHPTIERHHEGIYLKMPGYGRHELIIESPLHELHIATMSVAQIEIIIETYHRRYLALMANPQHMMVSIFRNHGKSSGASLPHPHSQIIATAIVPHNHRSQEEIAQRYFDQWGRCLYCDILSFEHKEGQRMVAENNSFLAFVPFAAEVPYEIWLIPKRHQADFGSISPEEKTDFALLLKNVLVKLYEKLDNPDYNYMIATAPRYKAEEPHLHWYCQIRPRLTTRAGFELVSGININPSLPELDADFLRS